MSYYFAVHPEQEKGIDQWLAPPPIGKDRSAPYHSYQLERTFGDRPFETVLEERPMHTLRNMVGTEFYNKPKQQTQVYYGSSIDQMIQAKKKGTMADYNAKLSVATVSKGEFKQRLQQTELENEMFYSRQGYVGTWDPAIQRAKDASYRLHGHQPYKQGNGWKHSGFIPNLGGFHVSRASTL
jgi:hypothetical protein